MLQGQPLNVGGLRRPSGRECLFWAKGLLLAGVLPVWLAFALAVAPQHVAGLPANSKVSGISVAGVQVAALRRIYDSHDYDLDLVAQGRRGVPPIFVRNLPAGWNDMRVEPRKRAFVKLMLPLILRANADIRTERDRLFELIEACDGDPSRLSPSRRRALENLAERYRAEPEALETLKRRVDAVPVALALAQAANESAWGTSRFARKGNALFGQWTWNRGDGIAPKDPQRDKGEYAVRAFDNLGESVAAYMRNLNTHDAYLAFRKQRARMRRAGQRLDPLVLAEGLLHYSQRGTAYIAEIRKMIRYNDFQRFSGARLAIAPLG